MKNISQKFHQTAWLLVLWMLIEIVDVAPGRTTLSNNSKDVKILSFKKFDVHGNKELAKESHGTTMSIESQLGMLNKTERTR